MVSIHVTDRKKIMKLKMLAGVAVLALIGAGVASAAIPDSSTGVITGCYQTSGGTLRVINKQGGAACYAWETELPWNQTGPAGATGATGATGPQGPAGSSPTVSTWYSNGNYYFSVVQYSGNYAFVVNCPSGYTLTSGGYRMYETGGGFPVYPLVVPMEAKPISTTAYEVRFSPDNLPRTVAVGVDITCINFS